MIRQENEAILMKKTRPKWKFIKYIFLKNNNNNNKSTKFAMGSWTAALNIYYYYLFIYLFILNMDKRCSRSLNNEPGGEGE